ncbi:creatininase family protein [Vineibacter terrae]|uniref:Creatininase family protein n=1 Tax=Vineibacter terrae TaxID=2586908 RepID=A0A5C8PPK0_9HYPH|nr:creatininase family protein [Vineibacter terrae]TXL75950.1 creatininase family protein [Vineibacter terrae]
MAQPASSDYRSVPLFDEMTSPEVAAAIASDAAIFVSLGATEQHGAHLPLGSDTMQGLDISRRAVHRLQQEGIAAIVGPVIPFGPRPFLSETPRDYPGTVNISNNTLRILLEEVCRELIGQGFRRIYLVLANAESDPPMQIVAKELSETTEANLVTLNWLVGVRPHYPKLMKATKPQGHGGEGETCRMLATAPHLVRMNEARPWHPTVPDGVPFADYLPYLGGGVGRYKMPDPFFAGFSDGITGDPQLASAEVGEKVYELVTDWITSIVKFDLATTKKG